MSDQLSLSNIDSLLFQFALQTRELSQKKNELQQQIKVCRADIAERRTYIESLQRNIKKLEEETRIKQSTVKHNKANAKSMKATNSLLLQYEQMLKAELESRKASYNHDMEVYEERIISYRKIFQSHKEYYYQNPLAQKLLMLQAEKEATDCRIKICDEQITIKQKELDHLTGPAAISSSTEEPLENVSVQEPATEPEKQSDPQIQEDSDSSVDISSVHLNQTTNGHKVTVEVNAGDIHEENKLQDTSLYPEEASNELWSCEKLDEQRQRIEIPTTEHDKETAIQDQAIEQQTTSSEIDEPVEDEGENSVSVDEAQAPSNCNNEAFAAFSQSSSQEINQFSSPAKVTAASSTQTFSFNFSPASSPHQGTSDRKSPAFLFSLNSDSGTTGFSGFGFDMGSSQDEKTTESKSSSCPGFLFAQSEQGEDFQFAFTNKSPPETNKDNRDEFPFSFNF
ncbi:uncharacterized protein LOC113173014 isoform X2 [Anabas testudineus]|uniref:uncharacterized protein LOC113173014 isoform X2 n=1 Tax=Anabas testudineus TaxID=64144 RepID=UPI000E45FF9E|nr:uncharacterized protein LOC113173014 isoform X2 [Anabas testudineus]